MQHIPELLESQAVTQWGPVLPDLYVAAFSWLADLFHVMLLIRSLLQLVYNWELIIFRLSASFFNVLITVSKSALILLSL